MEGGVVDAFTAAPDGTTARDGLATPPAGPPQALLDAIDSGGDEGGGGCAGGGGGNALWLLALMGLAVALWLRDGRGRVPSRATAGRHYGRAHTRGADACLIATRSGSKASVRVSRPSGGIFDVPGRQTRLSEIEALISDPTLWNDQARAQGLLKERTELTNALERLAVPGRALDDAQMLIEMGEAEGDSSVGDEMSECLDRAETAIDALEFSRMLGGELDKNDAILTINAGAGGTESQDWAEMLLRMYVRFCERQGWGVTFLDRQDGEEAGLKSASLSVKGDYAYGMMKAEAGVHRLVRISPFDASARRHTSFAACFVYPDIEDDIEIDVQESDLRIDTYRASGAGGQHVNRTDSAVRLTHLPSGIVVTCQSERSQHQNKAHAMKVLKARLYELEQRNRDAEKQEMENAKQDIAFGSQIRSYVMHPYRLVKDVRTQHETSGVDAVMDGDLEPFIRAYLIQNPSDA